MVVIDHRHPLGIFAFRFYANPAFDRGKDLRLEEPGDGAGIVQRRAVEAPLFIFVVGHKEVEQFGDDGRHRVANLAESLDIGGKDLRLMGDVKARHHHRDPRLKDHFRGLRINVNIKLRRRLPVAQPHGAPHDHDAGDLRVQLRMAGEQQRHVSLRPGGHQSHRLLAFPQHAGHQFDGGAVLRRKGRLRQARAIQSALAVHVIGDDQIAHQRLPRAAGHRDIRPVQQRQHTQHVAQGLLRGLVARGSGDGFHLQLRRGEGEDQGDRVIMSRIAINHYRQCHSSSLLAMFCDQTNAASRGRRDGVQNSVMETTIAAR